MSFFTSPSLSNYISTAKTFLTNSLEAQTIEDGESKTTFLGLNAPFIGRYGVTVVSKGGIYLGRFRDPRSFLRDAKDNKVVVPPDFGTIASKPVPSTRGGEKCSASYTYDQLKIKLLQSREIFEDPEFPATDSSLYYSQRPPRPIKWMRPHEICANPEFQIEGASRFDVRQGELGDCWLLAAIACLSMHKDLFEQVVPCDQSFNSGYCGLFRFHFWRFGEWKEVVIDDRLPTYQGSLIYIHSTERNEFWSALMEKAYAKLCGSYEALRGGTTSEALEDFTGGIAEMFDLKSQTRPDLLSIMLKSYERSSLLACSIQADPNQIEARLPNGLIMGHAYSVTSVKMVDISIPGKSGKIPLVRIRNPWGNEAEWKGAWSDQSREWNLISSEQRQELGLTFDDDGEFWMSYKDFTLNFEKLEICHLGPQSMSGCNETSKRTWEMCIENGSWKARVNAGGCRNYLETFWTNPQFIINITDPDENDEDKMGTVVIGLMQKDRRKLRREGGDLLTIGYAIYRLLENQRGTLDMNFFKYNASVARSPAFINLREVCGRHRLAPGRYVIIPSTFQPNEEADFVLRIFTERPYVAEELDEETELCDPLVIAQPLNPEQVEALKRAFFKVAGENGEIDAEELRDILNVAFTRGSDAKNFVFDGFSLEACRSMISMMDFDRSSMLSFEEFKTLWNLLRMWKAAFMQFDTDRSGSMNSFELRSALKHVGFSINNVVFETLVLRFANRDGSVSFDNYVICCARLRTLLEIFKATPKVKGDKAIFDESTFVDTVVYM